MPDKRRTAASKRTNLPRDSEKSKKFIKDWERLSRSGKHDMKQLKEAMILLIANDAPLSAEWRDHELTGEFSDMRECHIKGDLLLLYQIRDIPNGEIIAFTRAGTHSEIFS